MTATSESKWKIIKIEDETPQVKNIYLQPINDEKPRFIAGQYVTVKLPDQGPAEGKAYSISSAPHESHVRLSVKDIGDFSAGILAHNVGDILVTTKPYGFFYPEPIDTCPLVFVVGGIGITPCLSIIKDLAHKKDAREIQLHYSNQTENEIAFHTELQNLAAEYSSLSVQHYITREEPKYKSMTTGRMKAEAIVASADLKNESEFFICGAMDFTKSLWKALHSAGVPQHQLYTEGFF